MSGDLDLSIQLHEMRLNNCRIPTGVANVNQHIVNNVNRLLGDDSNVCVDCAEGDDGSNLFIALMYQNLLLLERVEALEERLK